MQSSLDFFLKPKIQKNDVNNKSSPTENQNKLVEKNNVENDIEVMDQNIVTESIDQNDVAKFTGKSIPDFSPQFFLI